jgi:hypothetical protein
MAAIILGKEYRGKKKKEENVTEERRRTKEKINRR